MAKVLWTLLVVSFGVSVLAGVARRDSLMRAMGDSTFDALVAKARAAAETGDPAAAEALYERLAAQYPGREDVYLAYAAFAQTRNNEAQVRDLYERAVHSGPRAHRSLVAYAYYLDRMGEPGKALEVCQSYVDRNPGDPWARYELGMRLLRADDPEAAKAHFKVSSETDALRTQSLQRLAQAHFALEQYRDAIRVWERAMAGDATLQAKQSLYDIGRAYEALDDVGAAVTAWETCFSYFPNSLWCARNLKAAYDVADRPADADRMAAFVQSRTAPAPVERNFEAFLELAGTSALPEAWQPGASVVVTTYIVYSDNRPDSMQPRVTFELRPKAAPNADPIVLAVTPARLSPGPWWRGDCAVQSFALSVPATAAPGQYELVMAVDRPGSAAVTAGAIAIHGTQPVADDGADAA